MKKILFAAALAVSTVIISSACKNPPIFAAIEQEVKLTPASVKGFVRGVVRIGDTLYASNGKIFWKSVGDRGIWSDSMSKMSDYPSGLCTSIATNGTDLYASFVKDEVFTVHRYNTGTSKWEPMNEVTAQSVVGTNIVFAINPVNTTTYMISPIGVVSPTSWFHSGVPKGAARTYCLFDDGLYSHAGTLISDSPTSGLKGVCEGPANAVFVFDNSILYCYDGTTWTNIAHGVSNPQSITYLSNKKLVLIGGIKGFGEIKLASATNLANAKNVSAGSDDSSVPSENIHQYNNSVGKYTLNPIYAFDYGTGYIIYTGVNDPNAKYTGLWGFYNPDRKQWNRE